MNFICICLTTYFRLKKVHHLCPRLVSYFGGNSFTLQLQKIQISIECSEILFVFKSHGMTMQMLWPNGPVVIQVCTIIQGEKKICFVKIGTKICHEIYCSKFKQKNVFVLSLSVLCSPRLILTRSPQIPGQNNLWYCR